MDVQTGLIAALLLVGTLGAVGLLIQLVELRRRLDQAVPDLKQNYEVDLAADVELVQRKERELAGDFTPVNGGPFEVQLDDGSLLTFTFTEGHCVTDDEPNPNQTPLSTQQSTCCSFPSRCSSPTPAASLYYPPIECAVCDGVELFCTGQEGCAKNAVKVVESSP